ncbi:MAG TPA: secondary thiamine-phosphate synthase enzyme YjbQ [Anaerohalosphaeraceae bacterium]|nr:secondary thiamine-phosphate synthase enzyme YjbQ [Anaerohalosphaeraceae bacterium]
MNMTQKVLSVSTSSRNQMLNITHQVEQIVSQSGIQDGIVTVFCPHTTAGITINENADPDVCHDILLTLNKLLPQNLPGYQHCEGNSDAHVKSSLVGCSRQVMLSKGSLVLGTWQGLFFCEFDGPRTRSIHVQIMGQ